VVAAIAPRAYDEDVWDLADLLRIMPLKKVRASKELGSKELGKYLRHYVPEDLIGPY
jgi:hypothetical protein